MEDEKESDPLFPERFEAHDEKEEREQCEGDKWMEPDIPISFEVVDIMPQRLEEMLLTLMAKTFGSSHRFQYVITLLSLALRDRGSDENEFDLNEERVFDKGEANLFAEPLNLTKMCVKTLKRMHVDSSLLNMDSYVPCSILALTGLENCEMTSITNFLKHALRRVIWKLNVCGKNSGGQFDAFLTQGFDSLQQDVFKVGLILYTFKELSKVIGDLYEELCKSLESAGIHNSFQTFCE
ncbi:hypothetical protein J437_LFUL009837 [Ladona fulva]|uniref:Uncharacterized protein n=1 Tax=Ladona fulva TaxID=123851 RepID=A0A8K0K7C8_LADFU|nr:hypothetical protein J437_LFUL009837 [Ladona fulva]